MASDPGSMPNSSSSKKTQGIGSAGVMDEGGCPSQQRFVPVKIDRLPRDAARFRGWKNAFVTQLCSIDKTGKDMILHWVVPTFEVKSSKP